MLTPDESGIACVLTLLLGLLAYWAMIFLWGWTAKGKDDGET